MKSSRWPLAKPQCWKSGAGSFVAIGSDVFGRHKKALGLDRSYIQFLDRVVKFSWLIENMAKAHSPLVMETTREKSSLR
jgi:hypothetical protein